MTELLTAAQMRAIEQAAIESGEVTGLELMERAGAGVVEAIFEEWPELAKTSHRAVVLCGPGNNGGDGFVVARLLHEWGWEVEVFLYGDEDKLPPDAKVNCERWLALGELGKLDKFDPWGAKRDVLIDAVFGTGLTRPVQSDIARSFDGISIFDKCVAIDIPSGFCADSGRNLFELINEHSCPLYHPNVNLTITFQYMKCGHVLNDCAVNCGNIKVVNIGLDHKKAMRLLGKPYDPLSRQKADFSAILTCFDGYSIRPGFSSKESYLSKSWDEQGLHKYHHGHAYILSGPSSKTGAARLAARGALRIGAGVVTVASPPDAIAEHAAQLNAVMLTPVADAQALTAVLDDQRINAICVGPALGLAQDRAEVLAAVLAAKRTTVVDADALTLISQNKGLFDLLHDKCVLTPHGGEFARVFPGIAEKLDATPNEGPAYSKVDATREAAKRAGCVVLFKGADTVIAAPDGRCAINAAHYKRAAPWLATAGSGDVLAGFITGLLARGFTPMEAAETGSWLHVECALKFGPGLIAVDIAEQLPQVFRDLGL